MYFVGMEKRRKHNFLSIPWSYIQRNNCRLIEEMHLRPIRPPPPQAKVVVRPCWLLKLFLELVFVDEPEGGDRMRVSLREVIRVLCNHATSTIQLVGGRRSIRTKTIIPYFWSNATIMSLITLYVKKYSSVLNEIRISFNVWSKFSYLNSILIPDFFQFTFYSFFLPSENSNNDHFF